MIAESLDYMASQLEKRAGKKPTAAKLETATRALLKEVVKEHRRVCFDGDGYGDVCDVCPFVPDDQTDTDDDGIGDACE